MMFSVLKQGEFDLTWLVNQLSYADSKPIRKEVSEWRYKQDMLKLQRNQLAHALSHHTASIEPTSPVDVPKKQASGVKKDK